MDKVSKIELSQDELKLLMALINLAVKKGEIQLGDIFPILALVQKIDKFIEKPKEEVKPDEGQVLKN